METDGKSEQHVGVLNAFLGSCPRGTPLIANGEKGINGLLISNAMRLSAWLKKEIEIPFDEDLFYRELMKRVKTSAANKRLKNIVADTSGHTMSEIPG